MYKYNATFFFQTNQKINFAEDQNGGKKYFSLGYILKIEKKLQLKQFMTIGLVVWFGRKRINKSQN